MLNALSVKIILLLLAYTTLAINFEVKDFSTCRFECIDRGYDYFAAPDKRDGRCCSSDERWSDCVQYGFNTAGTESTSNKYFACPTGFKCGARTNIAKRISKIYKVDTNVLEKTRRENICNHEI